MENAMNMLWKMCTYQAKKYLNLIRIGMKWILKNSVKSSSSMKEYKSRIYYCSYVSEGFQNCFHRRIGPLWQYLEVKRRSLVPKNSVLSYFSHFYIIMLKIPWIIERENLDRFCQNLNLQIRIKVKEERDQTMNNGSRIALNMDDALFRAEM